MKTLFCLLALVAVSASLVLPAQQRNGVNCLLCEAGVRAAEDPADREAHTVEDKFDAECKKEFGSIPFFEKECEKYGNSKLDPIINELEGGTAPEDPLPDGTIREYITKMKTLLYLVAVVAFATAMVLPRQQDSALDCLLCRLAVNVTDPPVDNEVHKVDDKFIAECKQELSGIPFLEQECLDYAHNNLDPIIKELESGTAPEDICKKLNEC
ncbi:unnamed protein product [Caenorhabditis sp. 36 PRJEB53466]|nr:unnamed protein product [Caenorhabditis sp. 36 PRJEB53466]